MRAVVILAQVFVFFMSCSRPTPPPEPAAMSFSQEEEAFAWFGSLGFPDIRDKPFVEAWFERGFLIADDGDSFTLFKPDLSFSTNSRSVKSIHLPAHVQYRVLDLATEARARVEKARAECPNHFYSGPSFRLKVFVLAWACRRNGLHDVAHDLYTVAAKMQTNQEWSPEDRTMKEALARAAAELCWQDFVSDFADERLNRKDLLDRIVLFNRRFPDRDFSERGRRAEEILRRMILEDEEHDRDLKPGDQPDKEQRIEDLVFQLRDQTGQTWYWSGSCDIFGDRWGTIDRSVKTAAGALAAEGFDAVPRLIAALTDDRFTRAVESGGSYAYSSRVLRVGDCSLRILERISWRRFSDGHLVDWENAGKGRSDGIRSKVEAWWSDLKTKGEKQAMIDDAVKGDEDGSRASERLIELFPGSALGPVVEGAGKAKVPWFRTNYIINAAKIQGDGPVSFLLDEMKGGPFLGGRAAAARCLHERGRPEAVPAMIEAWKCLNERGELDDREGVEAVVQFLISSLDPDALRALNEFFPSRSLGTRMQVVRTIAGMRDIDTWLPKKAKDPDVIRDGFRRVLFSALKDKEQTNIRMGGGSISINPRICDLAADALHCLWPGTFDFNIEALKPSRDIAIARILHK